MNNGIERGADIEYSDAWGLSITAPSREAAARFRDLIDAYLTMSPEIASVLGEAISGEAAPLSKITYGYMMLLANTAAGRDEAADVVDEFSPAPTGLNQREQGHLTALSKWAKGDTPGACSEWAAILDTEPLDMLAARLEHFERFSFNDLDGMLSSVQRLRSIWDDDTPYRSYLDGMACFSLEELGRYDEAEELGRGAVDAAPRDLWSIHSVAHVLEMQGRADDGINWLEPKSDVLHSSGSFAGHIWWHLGLYHLAHDDHDEVLRLLDELVRPDEATEGLTLTNAISMLARLDFLGVDVGDRWDRLPEGSALRIGYHAKPFNDCHFAYALARTGHTEELEALIAGMEAWSDRSDEAARVIREVGLATAKGMAALGARDDAEAASLLGPAAANWPMLGGSNAQRDVFARALNHAAR